MVYPVTAQMVVKNEERFIWFAVNAILPYVRKFLITDTGSTDQTLHILKMIKSPKIELAENRQSVVEIRKRQLAKTNTPWFLLVDGDEIWPQAQVEKLLKKCSQVSKQKIAVVNQTRNCVGDVWHYLPDDSGKYHFGRKIGHFNIRLMRNLNYQIIGNYPWEEYQWQRKSVNDQENKLAFSDAWYLHLSHLPRSAALALTAGRRKYLIEKGIKLNRAELPEILLKNYPQNISDPLVRRSKRYEFLANIITPMKKIKRCCQFLIERK